MVNGRILNQFSLDWDETDQDWMNGFWDEYTYDDLYAEKSNLVQHNRHIWNPESSVYDLYYQQLITYRQDISPDNLLSDAVYLVDKPGKVMEDDKWIGSEGNSFLTVYYYTALENPANVVNLNDFGYMVFPNPATDLLTISGLKSTGSILIYDMQGKLLLNQRVGANEVVNISSLTAGLYIYQIVEEQKIVKTGKLIKN